MSGAPGARDGSRIRQRSWFDRSAASVAVDLLGSWLVVDGSGGTVAGRITETEAYLGPEDQAAHSASGRTQRNATMWGDPGYLYVYRIYGIHRCANVVCGPANKPEAVLLRAATVERGVRLARTRRGERPTDARLAAGPGNLAAAYGITEALDGSDLVDGPVWIAHEPARSAVAVGPRIGMSLRAGAWALAPLRFRLIDEPSVSRG